MIKLRAAVCVFVMGVIGLSVGGLSVAGQGVPYLKYDLLYEFSQFAKSSNVPFVIELERRLTGEVARATCTAPLVYQGRDYLYGLIADHCIMDDEDFMFRSAYVGGQRVEILPYYRPPSEVRIWRLRKSGQPQKLVEIATEWVPGVIVFITGFRAHLHEFEQYFALGFVQVYKGVKLRFWGDIAHSAPALSGFSGGGNYFYNTEAKRFELAGITVGAATISLFTYIYSVPPDLWETIERYEQSLGAQGPSFVVCANDDWPSDFAEAFKQVYEENLEYFIDYRQGVGFVVSVASLEFVLEDKLFVAMQILKNKLKIRGKMQDVDWSQYRCVPLRD